ncbi:MAG: type III-B CRISPR-associated protein Cas10/Cmr2 [bacterium]|nr:type III-B CRISPR-associated protein Cas10/Cmr2 [bacterium]
MNNKLRAFFHDPIDKPFNIYRHKEKAEEYYNLVKPEEKLFTDEIEESDRISAAADRIRFTQNITIDFNKKPELTHPLGSERLEISKYGYISPEYQELERVISESIVNLKNNSKNDKTFLINLWRNIPDIFTDLEIEKFKLGNLWNLLPADTRIPDHSILDHNWLSVAITGSLPEPAFLKFSFGPVQSFILTSKRTEDYWMGSYIISYLTSKAIEVIIDNAGPEHIILPNIKNQPLIDRFLKNTYEIKIANDNFMRNISIPSLSNIIFAILPHNQAETIAKSMQETIKTSFYEIAKKIKDSETFRDKFSDSEVEKIWSSQIENFFETYYVIYKLPAIDTLQQNYKDIFGEETKATIETEYSNIGNFWQHLYKIIDTAFNSRKNIRTFNQLTNSPRQLNKCSLCGEREILVNKGNPTEFWKEIAKVSDFKINIDGKEKLCAICFIKRMAGELYFKEIFNNQEVSFPSTATIATLPFKIAVIEKWNSPDVSCSVKKYVDLLKQIGIQKTFNCFSIRFISDKIKKLNLNDDTIKDFLCYDGQWLFEESFTEKNLSEYGIKYNEKKDFIQQIRGTDIGSIKHIIKNVGDKPSKYFAVISMDGDNMGKWLSGTHENFPSWKEVVHSDAVSSIPPNTQNLKRNLSPSLHSFISRALNKFSLKLVRDIVEYQYPGKLVYSGGDDVLAFIPVEYAIEVAQKIRFTFSGNINEDNNIFLAHKNGYIVIREGKNKTIYSTLGDKATMSAGIVIAHKDHDLTDTLKTVQSVQKEAKDIYGRDAFVIKIIKRSGNIVKYGSKWKNENTLIIEEIKTILENVAGKQDSDGLSMSFFQSMFNDIGRIGESQDLIKSLLKLGLTRHILIQSKKDAKEKIAIKNSLINKMYQKFNNLISNNTSKEPIENLFLVLRFLSSGGKN